MSDLDAARTAPEDLLWKELGAVHAGMLGIEGTGQHMQPMAHFPDREGRRLWFLTKAGTELYRAVGGGGTAHFAIVSKGQDFHACMRGTLREQADRAKLDAIWNPIAGAWFDGKDDPELRMLALELKDAGVWASTGSSVVFAWEMVKANIGDGRPDVGVHNEVVFA
jgi:general stress protein 26